MLSHSRCRSAVPLAFGGQFLAVLLLQVALITGGDSGIGRAIALAYAREGADVAVAYLNEHEDAEVGRPRDPLCIGNVYVCSESSLDKRA
jgi:NAD(P)-dependent dehydrogenase (short-subunit alcohol dehydrogenase family)